jgi:hypothetical protein
VEWTFFRKERGRDAPAPFRPAAGTFYGWPRRAAEIRFLDPCMGSGHFLVFVLPILARLRMEEEGWSAAAAVAAVLRDNLHGLEIDERCTQIAAFNVALTAWRLGGWQPLPMLHLACSGLAPNTPEETWIALAGDDDRLHSGMARLYGLFKDAPVLGSLIDPRGLTGDLIDADFSELKPLLAGPWRRTAVGMMTDGNGGWSRRGWRGRRRSWRAALIWWRPMCPIWRGGSSPS